MTIVSPSLLACDFLNLREEMNSFKGIKDLWFHLDIMDAHFVPNLTFGHPIVKQLAEESNTKLDAHLMVDNPAFYIETFKDYKIHNLTFHWEQQVHHDRLIQSVKEHYPSVGISLNPSTPDNVIPDYILKQVDLVLVMSVNPGFGGQKFIKSSLDKIESLNERRNELNAKFEIQVDGGVNNKNAVELIKKGANNLVAGSYIFKADSTDYSKQVESLR